MTFQDFNFNEHLLESLLSMGYTKPTTIQQQAIPVILNGKDLIACAQTGTGKTASFLLPAIQHVLTLNEKQTTVLILVPTRELAQQIDQQVEGLAYFTGVSSVAVYGGGDGMAYEQQRRAIQQKVDIIIATPGRLLAHLTSGFLKPSHIRQLILDEADRMLDMGFLDDIKRIISYLPTNRQTILLSATMPPKIRTLARSVLKHPEQINLEVSQPAAGVDQQIYRVSDEQKIPLISYLFENGDFKSAIIFASRKEKVKAVYKALSSKGLEVRAFHSDLEQQEREEILLKFKNRQLQTIIGTDVLSRGIDVEGISLVINFDAPADPEDYIHRVGRTARAETTGTAITFVNEQDQRKLANIEHLIGKPIPKMPLPVEIGEEPVFKPLRTNKPGGKRKPWKTKKKMN
ncbi:DEAD/DEAH box helicase [Rubrolithibacter danxiaensis]|uniref:DEAD/DEAH box helicase n=1 Tax=Rubrolithibacter danxiaensis TaxID=3390805 RepID=UPI003BF78C5C